MEVPPTTLFWLHEVFPCVERGSTVREAREGGGGGGVAEGARWVGESNADVRGAEVPLERVRGALVAARYSTCACLCAWDY